MFEYYNPHLPTPHLVGVRIDVHCSDLVSFLCPVPKGIQGAPVALTSLAILCPIGKPIV